MSEAELSPEVVLDTPQDFPVIMELIGKDWFLSKLEERSKQGSISLISIYN